MKRKGLFLIAIMSFIALNGMAQKTWNVGYPNETYVRATLTDGTLVISGTGDMKDDSFGLFENESVSNVIIENGVTSIGTGLFAHCVLLKSITIPNSITRISDFALFDCPVLAQVFIPASVNYIGMDALGDDEGLMDIFVEWVDPNSVEYGCCIFEEVNTLEIKLHVPTGTRTAYNNNEVWKEFTVMEAGEEHVDDVYAYLSNLTTSAGSFDSFNPRTFSYSLTVPESVSTISLIATPMGNASVSGAGQKTLSIGANTFQIVVTSKVGNIQNTYTVTVTRTEKDYFLAFLNGVSITTPFSYYDLVQGTNKIVAIVSGYYLRYQLVTGQYSGDFPLNFNLSLNGSQKEYNTTVPVNANSVYTFLLRIDLNYDNPLKITTHFDAFGRPSSVTIGNYDFHTCSIAVSDDGYTLAAGTMDMPWTLKEVSIEDFRFIKNVTSVPEVTSPLAISVFPSPATDFINVSGLQPGEMLYVFNINGQQLSSRKVTSGTEQIAVGHLPAGIYLLRTDKGQTLKWEKR